MKLFGKDVKKIFEKKQKEKWEDYFYDFHQHGGGDSNGYSTENYITISTTNTVGWSTEGSSNVLKTSDKPKKKASRDLTPKEVYNLDTLQDHLFQIKTDPKYIERQVATLEKKMKLMLDGNFGNKWGKIELQSMQERMKNRLRLDEFTDVVDEYMHTSTAAINDVLKAHDNLRFKVASEFIPDFPDEAVESMERYTNMCMELSGKKPVFYVIADKKDFGEKDRRRDPILLAQSPFGFFWQILGAWDEEMIYLGDL